MTPELQELVQQNRAIQDEIGRLTTLLVSSRNMGDLSINPAWHDSMVKRLEYFKDIDRDVREYVAKELEHIQAEEGDTGDPGDTGFYGEGPDVEEDFYSDIQSPDTGDTGYPDNDRLVAAREAIVNQEKQRKASPSGVIGKVASEPEFIPGKHQPGPTDQEGYTAPRSKSDKQAEIDRLVTKHDKAKKVERGLRAVGME